MLVKSLSMATSLALSLAISQSAFALTPPEDGQDTCLIGEKIVSGIAPIQAMLEAIRNCGADIETIVRATITAAPYASAAIVKAAIEASPKDALLIVRTGMKAAPSQFADDVLTVALEAGIDPANILEATAAGIGQTNTPRPPAQEAVAGQGDTALPTNTTPTPISGGISAS